MPGVTSRHSNSLSAEEHPWGFTLAARTFVVMGILGSGQEAETVAARGRGGEDLAGIMKPYPLFLGHSRRYDVFSFTPADTSRRKDALAAAI